MNKETWGYTIRLHCPSGDYHAEDAWENINQQDNE